MIRVTDDAYYDYLHFSLDLSLVWWLKDLSQEDVITW